jgi:hypothetical protein
MFIHLQWSLVKLLSLAQPLGAFTKQLTINNWRYGRCNWSGADVSGTCRWVMMVVI